MPLMGFLRPKVVTYADRGEVCTWRPQATPMGYLRFIVLACEKFKEWRLSNSVSVILQYYATFLSVYLEEGS